MPVIGSPKPGKAWCTTYFARPYDLKAGSVKDRLCAARPSLFLGVPLVWEKIADKMRALGADVSDMKKGVASWAKGKGLEHAKACQLGGDGAYPMGYGLADTLVRRPSLTPHPTAMRQSIFEQASFSRGPSCLQEYCDFFR